MSFYLKVILPLIFPVHCTKLEFSLAFSPLTVLSYLFLNLSHINYRLQSSGDSGEVLNPETCFSIQKQYFLISDGFPFIDGINTCQVAFIS